MSAKPTARPSRDSLRSWLPAANLHPGDRLPQGTVARVEVEAERPVRVTLATGETLEMNATAAMEIAR